jgi:hypothetical protein
MADQALQEQRQRPPTAEAGAPPDGGEEVVYDAAPAAKASAPPSGPKQQFEGVIQSVACGIDSASRFQLALELKTAAAVVHLQAPDYLKVAFLAANFTPTGVMNPCHDLTGLHAVIHAVGGQMVDITLRH